MLRCGSVAGCDGRLTANFVRPYARADCISPRGRQPYGLHHFPIAMGHQSTGRAMSNAAEANDASALLQALELFHVREISVDSVELLAASFILQVGLTAAGR
jgi:hypothetical protein